MSGIVFVLICSRCDSSFACDTGTQFDALTEAHRALHSAAPWIEAAKGNA